MTVAGLIRPASREHYRAQLAHLTQTAPALGGARLPWLQQARDRAFERYAELGLPSIRDEDWKYTNVAALDQRTFEFAAATSDGAERVDPAQFSQLVLADCGRLVFVDGFYSPALSQLGKLPAGVTVSGLAAALLARPQRFEAWLADAADLPGNGFGALNAALWADGAYVELAAGTALEKPLQLLFITTRPEQATHPRNLIHLGANAHAEIVEQHVGLDDASYFTNAYTEIVLERGATLTHTKLQQEGRRAFHIADLRCGQAQDSRFTSQAFAFGGLLSRAGITTSFDAEGCTATLLGLYLANGRQHIDHHTRIDHACPRGTSRQLYKGVLDGAARAVFNGKVIVHADAQHSDAEQSNRNLLLSEHAEVDTKPQLEIYADDVKCSHGATVGQLDEDQVFYLRSRGVDGVAARALLTYAFAAEVVARVDHVGLRTRLDVLLHQHLPTGIKDLP
jgi:Fe-S cluster assembly protein SufD